MFKWNKLVLDSDLKGTEKMVLQVLATYANEEGKAWPSVDTIAKFMGMDRSTVFRALTSLKKNGWVTVSGKSKSVTYSLDTEQLQGASYKSQSETISMLHSETDMLHTALEESHYAMDMLHTATQRLIRLVEKAYREGDLLSSKTKKEIAEEFMKYTKGGASSMIEQFKKNKEEQVKKMSPLNQVKETYRQLMIETQGVEYLTFTMKDTRNFKDMIRKGGNDVLPMVEYIIPRWIDFHMHCKDSLGMKTPPDKPILGFLLSNTELAIAWMKQNVDALTEAGKKTGLQLTAQPKKEKPKVVELKEHKPMTLEELEQLEKEGKV